MTEYFYTLTRRNWGFPWHIILANFGMIVGFVILQWLIKPWSAPRIVVLVWLLINAIGFWYEWKQRKEKQGRAQDFREDILANNIGIALGVIEIWML